MPWTTPITPVPQTTITVAWAKQTIVDNLNWLRMLTGGSDPPGSGYSPESVSTTGVGWVPKVSRTGDTMSNDLVITRSGAGQPGAGYLILGNNSAYYVGFDGSKHVLSTPRLDVQGDLYVYRAGTPSQGYVILGNNSAHYVGFDGTSIIADGSPLWTDANTGLRVTTAKLAALAVTTPKLADGAVTTAKLADGSVTVAQLASSVALVPSGLIALWNAPAPPAGWVIDSSYAGRTVIGAGGGFALVATGGALTHTHDIAHAHPQGTTEPATGTTMTVGAGSTTAPATGHTHQFTAPSHGAGGLSSQPGSSLPPYLVSNFIRKT